MANAYRDCSNLTGFPVCGPKVTNMASTYSYCSNLNECTVNWYSPKVYDATECFYGKNKSRIYNIHVPANSTTFSTMTESSYRYSIVGAPITWTNNGACWYNTTYNIYIYPDL
jgi:hypothetical protein